jgi:hypothetical protein
LSDDRGYRRRSPECILQDLSRIREPAVFIVDDGAFIHGDHGLAVGEAVARKGLRKRYGLATTGDVLLRNEEVFRLWARFGLRDLFLHIEPSDPGPARHRMQLVPDFNRTALECARSLGLRVECTISADPRWHRSHFGVVRKWCETIPERVRFSVKTPFPGSSSWPADALGLCTRDYRLFDLHHAVVPTRLPLREFYDEVDYAQETVDRRHSGWTVFGEAMSGIRRLFHGRRHERKPSCLLFSLCDGERRLADHYRPVRYELTWPQDSPGAFAAQGSARVRAARERMSQRLEDGIPA